MVVVGDTVVTGVVARVVDGAVVAPVVGAAAVVGAAVGATSVDAGDDLSPSAVHAAPRTAMVRATRATPPVRRRGRGRAKLLVGLR